MRQPARCARNYRNLIVETCRDIIDFELDIKRINRLIPKYKYGGIIKRPLTREESLLKFNQSIQNSDEGILYLFASSIGESASGFLFLQLIIDISIYIHEYFREEIVGAKYIFELTNKHGDSRISNEDGILDPYDLKAVVKEFSRNPGSWPLDNGERVQLQVLRRFPTPRSNFFNSRMF